MHLIHKLNKSFVKRDLDKTKFSIFVPPLINFNRIEEYTEKILEFRKKKNKKGYIFNFVKEFYGAKTVPAKKINDLFDYGYKI